jgi:soluble lytic murein transglycosylase-like protein
MVQMFLVVTWLCLAWLPAQADIIRHWNDEGRLVFTNTPVASSRPLKNAPRSFPSQLNGHPRESLLRQLIHNLARQHEIEPRLIQAIVAVESNYNPHAVSRAGAQGLMQLMPSTAARYRVAAPFDPRANVEGGIRYLKDLLRLFSGNLQHVLAAYNAGENAVLQYGGIPPYPETQQYIKRVLALYSTAAPPRKIYRYQTANGSILFTDTPR